MKDRIAGAGLLAILVQLLLFQATVTSFTCSTMSTASAAQGPAIVICHSAGTDVANTDASTPVHRSGPGGVCFDCPCGVCCATGSAVFASLAPEGDLGPAYTLARDAEGGSSRNVKAVPATPPLDLRPDPTGPPALSA